MRPIFNKKVAKKCNLWDRKQYTYALSTVDKVNNCGLGKKKKKKRTWRRNVDVGFSSKQTVTMSLASSLQYFSLSHTCRQGNGLVHTLVRRVRFSFPVLAWIEFVPPDIHKHFIYDFLAIK